MIYTRMTCSSFILYYYDLYSEENISDVEFNMYSIPLYLKIFSNRISMKRILTMSDVSLTKV